jgi:hypothetical protein
MYVGTTLKEEGRRRYYIIYGRSYKHERKPRMDGSSIVITIRLVVRSLSRTQCSVHGTAFFLSSRERNGSAREQHWEIKRETMIVNFVILILTD